MTGPPSVDPTSIPSGGGPLVFVADLDAPHVAPDDVHHLGRVRRVRPGDPIVVGDGEGRWRSARYDGEVPTDLGEVVSHARPTPVVGVGFALVKGAKPELVVQKLTELGVDEIRPFVAARSVVRWDPAKAAANRDRLQKVAREAAMQSRQAWVPVVHAVVPFAEVAALPGACLADRASVPVALDRPLVLVGPEGGWDESERAAIDRPVALATGVLRAETAAIVAGTLLTTLRSGLLSP